MKRFFFGYVAGALSMFLGLAYWHSYRNAKTIEQFRARLQEQVEWMKRGIPHE